jgi:hypothetical protein
VEVDALRWLVFQRPAGDFSDERSTRKLLTQYGRHGGLKQFEAAALAGGLHAVGIRAQVHHFMPELRMVATDLVDDLLRTTH